MLRGRSIRVRSLPGDPGCNERAASRLEAQRVRAKSVFVQQTPGDCEESPVQPGCRAEGRAEAEGTFNVTVLPAEGPQHELPGMVPERLRHVQPAGRIAAECIKFKRPEMLRATNINGVLRGFGRIFVNSKGSASTYELSAPVDVIDVFLSHNWSTPRFDKFCVLALHFNFGKAILAMWVTAWVSVLFTVMGFLPMFEFAVDSEEGGLRKQGVSAHLVGGAALLLTFACGHEVSARLCCRGPSCSAVAFLDKTCIHQTDQELKQEGIGSLAAFLDNSRTLVIVYSKTYLKKLWTVYELASSLLLHPNRRVVVIPCFLPKMVLCGFLSYHLFMIVHRLLLFHSVAEVVKNTTGLENSIVIFTHLFALVMCIAFLKILEDWVKDRAEIKEVLQSFSIRNAMCFEETDRLVVQGNITSFMRDLRLVTAQEGEEEDAFQCRALDAFDTLVREEVPPALAVSFGRQGIPYRYVLLMFSSSLLRGLDQVAPCVLGDVALRTTMVVAAEHLTMGLAIAPLSVAMFTCAVQHATSVSSSAWRRRLRILALFVLVIIWSTAILFALQGSSELAVVDDPWLLIYSALVVVLFLLVFSAYRPVQSQTVARKSSYNSEQSA